MEEGLWWEAATSPYSSFLRNSPHPQGVSDRFLSLSRVFIPGKGLWERMWILPGPSLQRNRQGCLGELRVRY